MRDDRKNLIVDLTFDFALQIIEYVEVLEKEKKYVVAKQLIRCGTSVGSNTREAQNSERKADFIHKFKIVAKEADETQYWIDLSKAVPSYPNPPDELFQRLTSIIRIVSKIIGTSKG